MQESRFFKIIYYLLDKGHTTAFELAERFEVSVRTIYRDIDVISSAGIPIYTSSGRNGGIRLADSFVLNKSLLTVEEQRDILLALHNMEAARYCINGGTITKVSALFQKQVQQWIEIDFSQWGEYNNINDKFELLKMAILKQECISFIYADAKGEVKKRVVNPIKLLYRSTAWYLQAFCMEQEEFRNFKISRIQDILFINKKAETLEVPSDKAGRSPDYIHVELHFSDKIAYRVYDEFSEACITRQRDGSLKVSVDMPEEEWLIRYLLSFGKFIKVLSPAKIHSRLLKEAKMLYENNLNL